MRTPTFVAWLKYQWRTRRAKTVAGHIFAEIDYINHVELMWLHHKKMDDISMMKQAGLFYRRNFLMDYLGSLDLEE